MVANDAMTIFARTVRPLLSAEFHTDSFSLSLPAPFSLPRVPPPIFSILRNKKQHEKIPFLNGSFVAVDFSRKERNV